MEEQPEKYHFVTIKALNDDGSCIWGNRYTPKFFEDRRQEVGDRVFESQYQGQPLDETGEFFDTTKLQFIDRFNPNNPLIDGKVRSYDCAYSDESKGEVNDRTASVKMYHTIDDHYIITELSVGRYGDKLFNKIKSTARIDTPNIPIVIETGTAGGSSRALFDVYKKDLQGYNVKQSKPLTSKVDRAFGFKEAILDGKVYVCLNDEAREQLLQEMKGFPLMKRDDIIDACSYAFNYLFEHKNTGTIATSGKRKRRGFIS
jgi:phage terminase large subunit-like protein